MVLLLLYIIKYLVQQIFILFLRLGHINEKSKYTETF